MADSRYGISFKYNSDLLRSTYRQNLLGDINLDTIRWDSDASQYSMLYGDSQVIKPDIPGMYVNTSDVGQTYMKSETMTPSSTASDSGSMTVGIGVAGWASLATGLISAFGDAITAGIQTSAAKSVANAQAQIAANNAEIAQMGYEQTFRQGEAEIGRITRQAGQLKSKQKTTAAANGVVVGVGNSAELLASTEAEKQVDVINAKWNTLAASWGYRSQRMQYQAQAKGYKYAADAMSPGLNALSAGLNSVAKTGLRGFGLSLSF